MRVKFTLELVPHLHLFSSSRHDFFKKLKPRTNHTFSAANFLVKFLLKIAELLKHHTNSPVDS